MSPRDTHPLSTYGCWHFLLPGCAAVSQKHSRILHRGGSAVTMDKSFSLKCVFVLQEYMHHLLLLEHRAEEQFLEHWLNPHCKPHCDRNLVHPI